MLVYTCMCVYDASLASHTHTLSLSLTIVFSSSFFRKDKDRLILYDWSTGRVVTSLYGASNDEYSQPRHCWHPNGQYIYGVRERERSDND